MPLGRKVPYWTSRLSWQTTPHVVVINYHKITQRTVVIFSRCTTCCWLLFNPTSAGRRRMLRVNLLDEGLCQLTANTTNNRPHVTSKVQATHSSLFLGWNVGTVSGKTSSRCGSVSNSLSPSHSRRISEYDVYWNSLPVDQAHNPCNNMAELHLSGPDKKPEPNQGFRVASALSWAQGWAIK